ncbi:MAG: response regulator, partial [Nitrospirales bacterium]
WSSTRTRSHPQILLKSQIFQVFTQADSSMSRKFGGSGLGLAICKQLAELMNGTVGVESRIGEGAQFWCDLPFHLSTLKLEKPAFPSDRRKSLLICASRSASIEVISRYLDDLGVRVIRVEEVQDAKAFFLHTQSAPSEILGIIVGREANNEAWASWLTTVRRPEFAGLKLWGLTPFWLRKSGAEHPGVFDEMITLPIHREAFTRCVYPEMEVQAMANGFSQPPTQEMTSDDLESSESVNQAVIGIKISDEQRCPSVLIVEDNLVNQKVAVGLFEKLGCRVYVAESGDRALPLLQEVAIDVVMMDWELPGMDGFETARAIRELEDANRLKQCESLGRIPSESAFQPCSHLPIVGMTAHGQTEKNQFLWRPVMDDCLSKPIHRQDLVQVLERWVGFKVSQGKKHQFSSNETGLEGQVAGNSLEAPIVQIHEPVAPRETSAVYDFSGALGFMEGDETLLHSLFHIFLDTAPDLIHGIQDAMASQDRQSLQHQVHQLKGALVALHATHQTKGTEQLEVAALVAPFSSLHHQVRELERDVEALMTLLRDWLSVASKP